MSGDGNIYRDKTLEEVVHERFDAIEARLAELEKPPWLRAPKGVGEEEKNRVSNFVGKVLGGNVVPGFMPPPGMECEKFREKPNGGTGHIHQRPAMEEGLGEVLGAKPGGPMLKVSRGEYASGFPEFEIREEDIVNSSDPLAAAIEERFDPADKSSPVPASVRALLDYLSQPVNGLRAEMLLRRVCENKDMGIGLALIELSRIIEAIRKEFPNA